MANAKVVFSNGSKQMAHNLDDQYERWQMRRSEIEREQQREASADEALELYVPPLPEFPSNSSAKDYRDILIAKQAFLQTRLAELNLKRKTSFYPDADYWHDRAPLALAITRINLQMHQCMSLSAPTVGSNSSRIKQLKEVEKQGELTPEEQIELETLRGLSGSATIEGMMRKAESASEDQRIALLEEVAINLRKMLVGTQAKLITAYERIIELETQRED